jgi:hypothetical protein
VGVNTSGPVWGRIVDHKGPRIPLIGASICLLVGYLGIKQMYDDGVGNGTTVSPLHFTLLVVCGFMTGSGGNAGLSAAINTTAKSFPYSAVCTLPLPPSAFMPSTRLVFLSVPLPLVSFSRVSGSQLSGSHCSRIHTSLEIHPPSC